MPMATAMPEPDATGFPDIAWLTQIANEMFRSQPGSPVPLVGLVPSTAVGGFGLTAPATPLPPTSVGEAPLPAIPTATVPGAEASVPGEGEIGALSGIAPGTSVPSNAVGGSGLSPGSTALPTVPSSVSPLGPTSLADLGALELSIPGANELRALLGAAPSAPYPPNALGGYGAAPPEAPVPGMLFNVPPPNPSSNTTTPFIETSLPNIPALDTALPQEEALHALLSLALSPGMAAPPATPDSPGAAAPSSFYFLDEAGHGVPAVAGTPAAAPSASSGPAFDANARRSDFPILAERVNGRPLIWLDNGATTQKPRVVIDRLVHFYEHENSNVHRAAHELAARSTDAYESARETVRRFLHAGSADEIVFVRGTTEAINLVAQSWGRRFIGAGDEIVITWLEHHANIVPWQMLCEQTGAKLRVAPVDDNGQVILEHYGSLLNPRTKLVSFTQVSNALGTITPSAIMTAMAHAVGARVLLDGAQSVPHMRTDVQAIGCDWFVFSGHKVFGPTGIGALYGRTDVLAESPPWQGGGNMIRDVTFEQTQYEVPPTRFEAGTGNIADAVGLATALDYVEQIELEEITAHEHALLEHATHLLHQIPGLRIIGTAAEKAAVLSFVIKNFDVEAIGKALNQDGIAVRAGHHCAQPILRRMGVEASVRATFALYNTHSDVEALFTSLRRMRAGAI
jgi:cysteine desulfurase/selenocysteine lyase